jgi:hypothetical protein
VLSLESSQIRRNHIRPKPLTSFFGQALRMRAIFCGKSLIFMVRSVALATRPGDALASPREP